MALENELSPEVMESIKEGVREYISRLDKCRKEGHAELIYLWTSNDGRSVAVSDHYQCLRCGSVIKQYNHQATQDFIRDLNQPCTI